MIRTDRRLVLASSSPRREALFKQAGIAVDIIPAEVDEDYEPDSTPLEIVSLLAIRKASQVAGEITDGIIIGADTVVVIDGEILGKPPDAGVAASMLRALSGRTHEVITGFCVIESPSGELISAHETTKVTFKSLIDAEIEDYIITEEPFDKAGAYGIQDSGALFIERIDGCYYNVMGFPLARFYTTVSDPEIRKRLRI